MERSTLKTPAEAFARLPDYPFEPQFCSIEDPRYGALAMHFVDEGPVDAPVVLMLHGEPTWSFLYRKIIPLIRRAGYRAVAPDHIGFGRSDKLAHRGDYSYQAYVDWLCAFIRQLDLNNILLVCQDWGGPIGLRALVQMEQRFAGVVVANTLLPACEEPPLGVPGWPGEIIEAWVATTREAEDLPVSAIVNGVCVSDLEPTVLAAYDAPFPDASYKAAALEFPSLIPLASDSPGAPENRAAWEVLEGFEKPFVTAFSDSDPSTKAWEEVFRSRVPGADNTLHTEISSAGHFLQEEQPEALAELILKVLHHLQSHEQQRS
jgi:haloalkane dehalogenase